MTDEKVPLIISVILLILAALPLDWPYGYYQLLRIVVFGTSIYLCFLSHRSKSPGWFWLFVSIAIIFNPVLKIHLSRSAWLIFNMIAFVIMGWFGLHKYVLKNMRTFDNNAG